MVDYGVAIIGCGAIGEILAESIDSGGAGRTRLEVLFDLDEKRAEELASGLVSSPFVASEFEQVLENRSVDLVVEAASQEAVSEYALDILEAGRDLVVLSVGAFSDLDLLGKVRKTAEKSSGRVYIPSGAILGLDGIQAAEIAGIQKAVLTTRKPSETLSATKFVKENNIDLSGLSEPKLVFEGSAEEAVDAFPGSVNVAASLSLAGLGLEKTSVKIFADPSLDENVHEIEVEGKAGKFTATAHNFPSPDNPKTSYLAALSAIRALRNLTDPIRIGT